MLMKGMKILLLLQKVLGFCRVLFVSFVVEVGYRLFFEIKIDMVCGLVFIYVVNLVVVFVFFEFLSIIVVDFFMLVLLGWFGYFGSGVMVYLFFFLGRFWVMSVVFQMLQSFEIRVFLFICLYICGVQFLWMGMLFLLMSFCQKLVIFFEVVF